MDRLVYCPCIAAVYRSAYVAQNGGYAVPNGLGVINNSSVSFSMSLGLSQET